MEELELLEKSIRQRQELLHIIETHKDEDGVCRLSQKEIGKHMGKSPTRVSQIIKAINREKKSIKKEYGGYVVDYENMAVPGLPNEVMKVFIYMREHPDAFLANENIVANELNISRATLIAAKTYLRDKKP